MNLQLTSKTSVIKQRTRQAQQDLQLMMNEAAGDLEAERDQVRHMKEEIL